MLSVPPLLPVSRSIPRGRSLSLVGITASCSGQGASWLPSAPGRPPLGAEKKSQGGKLDVVSGVAGVTGGLVASVAALRLTYRLKSGDIRPPSWGFTRPSFSDRDGGRVEAACSGAHPRPARHRRANHPARERHSLRITACCDVRACAPSTGVRGGSAGVGLSASGVGSRARVDVLRRERLRYVRYGG